MPRLQTAAYQAESAIIRAGRWVVDKPLLVLAIVIAIVLLFGDDNHVNAKDFWGDR